ncbi:MAG: SPOR domain-containing protein [Pseudomonadota bacterium]
MGQSRQRYDQDFGPFEDDYRGFDPSEDGARGPLILALVFGVLLIFAAVIWNTYKQGIRPDPAGLPVIMAESTPYKSRPDDPGGTILPDLDRLIYDQLDGSERAQADQLLQGGPPIELRLGQETEIDEVTGIPRAAIQQLEEYDAKNGGKAVTSEALPEPTEPAKPAIPGVDEIIAAKVENAPPKPASPAFRFSPGGRFLVQIGALRSQAAADTAWNEISSAEAQLFQGATKRIQRADLGAKGIFYRVRAGAFENRADAAQFCDALKGRGRACIVVSG